MNVFSLPRRVDTFGSHNSPTFTPETLISNLIAQALADATSDERSLRIVEQSVWCAVQWPTDVCPVCPLQPHVATVSIATLAGRAFSKSVILLLSMLVPFGRPFQPNSVSLSKFLEGHGKKDSPTSNSNMPLVLIVSIAGLTVIEFMFREGFKFCWYGDNLPVKSFIIYPEENLHGWNTLAFSLRS